MNKKMIAVLALLVIVISMAAASASDIDGSDFVKTKKVKIGGVNFKIPEKFKEDKSAALDGVYEEIGGVGFTTWSKFYDDKEGEIISIGVSSCDGVTIDKSFTSLIGEKKKTINGVKGYTYDIKPFKGFTYAKDGKLVIITVTHSNLLDEVVTK